MTFTEIYNLQVDIVGIVCGKQIFNQLVHIELAQFMRADTPLPLSKVRFSSLLRFASEVDATVSSQNSQTSPASEPASESEGGLA